MYQVGGSLKNNAPSYIERQADSQLYNALKQGEFCYVLNSRQMGKSSLLVRTLHRLQQEGYKCASIDMTSIGSDETTLQQWYKGIAGDLWRGLRLIGKVNLKQWWREEGEISALQRLSRFIADVVLKQFPDQPIVIFIDEIDSVLSLPFSIDDFFALVRFCYDQRALDPDYNRLTFAIFGVATPSDLIQDRKRTPFNIGTAIELTGFNLDEIGPLTVGLNVQTGNAQTILKEILAWTNGQPFLTQKLCQLAIASSRDTVSGSLTVPPGGEAFWVERIVKDKILYKWESQDEPEHLRTIRDRLTYREERIGRLLGLYQRILQHETIETDDSPEQIELLLSGLIVKQGNVLNVKNRIYAEVFNPDWVEKQLRLLRPYSQALDAWLKSQKTDDSRLLRGQALKDAQSWTQGKRLSDDDYQFLAESVECDRKAVQSALEAKRAQAEMERARAIEAQLIEEQKRRAQEQKNARLQRLFLSAVSIALVVSSTLGIITFLQFRRTVRSEIEALISSSTGKFESNQRLDALIHAIKASRQLKKAGKTDPVLQHQVNTVLQQAIYSAHESHRLSGHRSRVRAVAFSPDGTLIASTSDDNTIKLWREDGTLLKTLTQHTAAVRDIAFSPDGQTLVSASEDGTLKLWQQDGTFLKVLAQQQTEFLKVVFSPDGQRIAAASRDNKIRLWHADGTQLEPIASHTAPVAQIAFSPDGSLLVSTSLDKIVRLWRTDGTLVGPLEGEENSAIGIAFSPNGDWIAAGLLDGKVRLWRADGSLERTFTAHTDVINRVVFSPDSTRLVSASRDRTIRLWNLDGTPVKTLTGHRSDVWDIAFSPDGQTIASASEDSTVRLWQVNHTLQRVLASHNDEVRRVAFSPDSNLLASASRDRTIGLRKTDGTDLTFAGNHPQGAHHREAVFEVDFSPDGTLLASASADGTVKLWTPEGTLLQTLNHPDSVWGVTISPDNRRVAVAVEDKTVRLWSTAGEAIAVLRGHTAPVRKVTFSPDGALLASASLDGTVKLWDQDNQERQTLKGHGAAVRGLDFSPDGQTLASASADRTVKLWSRNGALMRTLTDPLAALQGEENSHDAAVWEVVFSPDGQILATASLDRTVRLWEKEGKLLTTLTVHTAGVKGVAFSPDGKLLASSGDDRKIVLWNVPEIVQLDELGFACNWIRDHLKTSAERGKERFLCDGIGQL